MRLESMERNDLRTKFPKAPTGNSPNSEKFFAAL